MYFRYRLLVLDVLLGCVELNLFCFFFVVEKRFFFFVFKNDEYEVWEVVGIMDFLIFNWVVFLGFVGVVFRL